MLHDIRYALRGMAKSPLLTAIILLTLAVGIGANVAIFTAVDAVLLKGVPVHAPDRLVLIWNALRTLQEERLPVTAAEYLNYRDHATSFDGVAGFNSQDVTLTGQGDPERVTAARVSASLFPLLGIGPAAGRTFSADEDRPNAPPVVVISDGLWRRRYGAAPSIVGGRLEIDRQPYEVIGIMPASFRFPFEGMPFARPADVWMPLALTETEIRSTAGAFDIAALARLKDRVTVSQASSEIHAQASAFRRDHPELYPGSMQIVTSAGALDGILIEESRPFLLLLMGAVGAVLLIACANVANLLLAKALVRSREFAIRMALGAERRRLIAQLLTESVLLAAIGGAAGFVLGVGALQAMRALGSQDLDWPSHATPDARVLLFTLVLTMLTGIGFGLVPALRMSRQDVQPSLHGDAMRTVVGPARHRLRRVLTVVQMALSILLLIGAGLLINSFLRVLRVPPGFDADGVLVAHTVFDQTRYPTTERRIEAERQLVDRLSAVPGVKAAAAASTLPLESETRIGLRIDTENFEHVHILNQNLISANYFAAMGIPLITGRAFTPRDVDGAPRVAIVSEGLARRFWPRGEVIGRTVKWGRTRPPFTIVGVVPDVRVSRLELEPLPMVYMPRPQILDALSPELTLVMAASGDPQRLASFLRTEVSAVDKDLPLFRVSSMRGVISASLAQRRFSMVLLSAFSLISLLLAASGLYAVLSYFTTERTREFGLRMALGARRGDVLMMVFRQAGGIVAIGLAIGVGTALALAGVMRGMIHGINPVDPVTFITVSLVFCGAALLASFVPALRAATGDPLRALKVQ
jgi:predicted permease